jgi:hypothetical protein
VTHYIKSVRQENLDAAILTCLKEQDLGAREKTIAKAVDAPFGLVEEAIDRLLEKGKVRVVRRDNGHDLFGTKKKELGECQVCGKTVRLGPRRKWIELVENGARIATTKDPEGGDDSLGYHPVGPECVKKLAPDVRTRETRELAGWKEDPS